MFTLSLPETLKAVLISESLDEITWCDHSYETSLAVLSHGTIYVKGLAHGVGYHARNISSDIRKISFLTSDKFTL